MLDHFCADIRHFSRASRLEFTCVVRLFKYCYGLHAVLAYRMGRWLRKASKSPGWWPLVLLLTPIQWLLTSYVRLAYGIHLDGSAHIGPGLYIGHFGGIRVQKCRLGAHCAIQQEVRLEPAHEGGDGPDIGDRVWIGAHARILGAIRVGDGATIGAGSFVIKDVAAGSLVLGNPARVVRTNYDNSSFL
jgi:serine O-acetyltransferase